MTSLRDHCSYRLLQEDGWNVAQAENGAAASERVVEKKPDRVLLDLMMPVMDRFDFVVNLRQDSANLDLPIIVVTAKDLIEQDRLRLMGGVGEIMQKSAYDQERLLKGLRNAITKQRATKP